jgi:hypothetical protein
VLIASAKTDPESCTHQAWSLPYRKEFYSSSPLHHFLRCVGRRELMLDALLKKSFNLRVLELRSIISSNLLDSQSELILSSSQESF